ncbi:hypothetical protein [Maridesulfovibrio sp. FT414]
MTGEGVEAIVVMLVIVFAVFHMVRKKSREGLDEMIKRHSDNESGESEEK